MVKGSGIKVKGLGFGFQGKRLRTMAQILGLKAKAVRFCILIKFRPKKHVCPVRFVWASSKIVRRASDHEKRNGKRPHVLERPL
jgi:hypothetical protein